MTWVKRRGRGKPASLNSDIDGKQMRIFNKRHQVSLRKMWSEVIWITVIKEVLTKDPLNLGLCLRKRKKAKK